jgi:hypothetical protein
MPNIKEIEVCPGFAGFAKRELFLSGATANTLTSQLKKVAGLPGMGWLAERPLRRRNSAATDKSILGYVFGFWCIRVASPFVTFVQSSRSSYDFFINKNKNDSHYP